MELTAEQVWELVKGWPTEARPTLLEWNTPRDPKVYVEDEMAMCGCCAELATALHEISGLKWLAMEGAEPKIVQVADDGGVYFEYTDNKDRSRGYWWESLLHAVSAAVMAVGEPK